MVTAHYYSQERPTTIPTTNPSALSSDGAEQWLETLSDAEVDELADLLASLDSMLDIPTRTKAS